MNPFDLPEWRALVAAVKAAPGDDLPRLVAADWLDEYDRPERAEFIRVQCERERVEGEKGGAMFWRQLRPAHAQCQGCSRWCRLQLRERALLVDFPAAPYWEVPAGLTESHPHRDVTPTGAGIRCHGRGVREVALTYRRGWIDRVACEAAVWWGVGPEIVKAHPVAVVEITDREPLWNGRAYCWFVAERHRPSPGVPDSAILPASLVTAIHTVAMEARTAGTYWLPDRAFGFATREEAAAALSAAALAWANG